MIVIADMVVINIVGDTNDAVLIFELLLYTNNQPKVLQYLLLIATWPTVMA